MPPTVDSSQGAVSDGKANGTLMTSDSESSGLLQTLQRDMDDLRAVIQCTICMKPLYEPFTLGCGHTFCYSCLTQWFLNHRHRETCPQCRSPVKSEPAPAYMVRNIVNLFISRAELLESGETTAEHLNNQQAETEKVEKDKASTNPTTGGLFQGCFRRPRYAGVPFHDASDGVDRCPECAWELEEGECVNCGFAVDMLSSSSFNSELDGSAFPPDGDFDMPMDMPDMLGDGGDIPTWGQFYPSWIPTPIVRRRFWQDQGTVFGGFGPRESSPDRSSRSSSYDDGASDEMDSFIDDDDIGLDGSEGSEQATVVGDGGYETHNSSSFTQGVRDDWPASPPGSNRAVSVSSDGDDDEDNVVEDDGEDDDDDDDEPIRPPGRISQLRSRAALQPYPPPNQSSAGRSSHQRGPHRGATAVDAIDVDDDSDDPRPASTSRRRTDTRRCPR